MAWGWLPIRLDITDDPAVILIADRTGLQEDAVVGKLVRLWSWGNRQLENGDAASVTKSWVDRFLYCPGFADAMVETGWLVVSDAGVSLSKFDRWNSKSAKKRLLTSRRNAEYRLRKGDASSVTNASPKEEKRIEEKKKKDTPPPPTAIALPFPSERFASAWRSFVDHRREMGKRLTPRSESMSLKKLDGLSEDAAVRCLEDSIANGWQGLFPEKHGGRNGRHATKGEAQDAYILRQGILAMRTAEEIPI